MPGMMPPAFGFVDGGPEGPRNKDGIYRNNGHGNAKIPIEGPLASKGKGDEHAFAQDDIRQGRLDNCWFMAALASIAKSNPDYVQSLITELSPGVFEVKLFKSDPKNPEAPAELRHVKVNNIFPVDKRTGLPVYADYGDDDLEIWVMVIEKAFATLYGRTYQEAFPRGFTSMGYKSLLGDEGEFKYIDDERGSEKRANSQFERDSRRFDKQWPDASPRDREKFAPKNEGELGRIREWEIIPFVIDLEKKGNAVTLSTGEIGRLEISDSWVIFGPHVYSIESIDEAQQTMTLMEPSGRYNLYDFPIKLVHKYMDAISYAKVPQ